MNEPSFTLGIEEEYLLVDRTSRDLIREAPASMMADCEALLEGQVTPEFFQCQIEVGTRVCRSMAEARQDLAHLRKTVAQVAEQHGFALIAASTHPFAVWGEQKRTAKERYETIEADLQRVVRRLMICGMHVHVGIDDDETRIDLMNQIAYALPHFLALTTSSPFWQGEPSGLRSYRVAVWDEMPRTGLPESFDSFGEFQRHLDIMVSAGLIEDGTKLWWDIRPSMRFPTLEMRICDIATRLEDGICVAALYRCWLHMLPPPAHRQPALAALLEPPHPREPVAGPTLRHRRGPGRFRERPNRALPGAARRDARAGALVRRGARLRRGGGARPRHPHPRHQLPSADGDL